MDKIHSFYTPSLISKFKDSSKVELKTYKLLMLLMKPINSIKRIKNSYENKLSKVFTIALSF